MLTWPSNNVTPVTLSTASDAIVILLFSNTAAEIVSTVTTSFSATTPLFVALTISISLINWTFAFKLKFKNLVSPAATVTSLMLFSFPIMILATVLSV